MVFVFATQLKQLKHFLCLRPSMHKYHFIRCALPAALLSSRPLSCCCSCPYSFPVVFPAPLLLFFLLLLFLLLFLLPCKATQRLQPEIALVYACLKINRGNAIISKCLMYKTCNQIRLSLKKERVEEGE